MRTAFLSAKDAKDAKRAKNQGVDVLLALVSFAFFAFFAFFADRFLLSMTCVMFGGYGLIRRVLPSAR